MNRFSVALPVMAVLAMLSAVPSYAQNAEAGQAVFKHDCAICHDVVAGKNRIGPSLSGIVGRSAGTIPGFHYSDVNKKSGLTWDVATLDRYLTEPRAAIPGTTMSYGGQKDAQKRRDLIAYLAALH